ncbi:unnamed protein product [Closterium sp. NIES-65]|nr:unnamed protein product [Closterium sp. NIES-65]
MSDPKVSASEAEEARSEAREPLGAQQAVMIFVKRPAPGRVKTRLAAGVGADAACDFYRACCEHVVTNIARCPDLYVTIASRCCGVAGRHASTHVFIFFSEPSDEGEIRRWMQQLLPSSTSLRFVPQVGGDVGARMQAAFQHVLGLGYQRVVVIGTDIPDVDGVTVAAALSALRNHQVSGGEGKKGTTIGATVAAALLSLRHHQVVFGPALDGGYYLLGLTAVLPCLFHGIEWSPDRVLQQSLSALHTNGVADVSPLDLLPRLRDIDTVHDLTAWLAEKRAEAGGEAVLEADTMVLSGCGVHEKTGNGENALRAAHAGVHPITHAPLGNVHTARPSGMEGGTDTEGLIPVVARILGRVSSVGGL